MRAACIFLICQRAEPRSLNAYHFHKYSLLYTHTRAWREDLQVSPRLLCAMLFHSVCIYSDSASFSVLHRQTCTTKVLQELRRKEEYYLQNYSYTGRYKCRRWRTYVKWLSNISPLLGGLSNVPKLQAVLLIKNDQSCSVLPLSHICQIDWTPLSPVTLHWKNDTTFHSLSISDL